MSAVSEFRPAADRRLPTTSGCSRRNLLCARTEAAWSREVGEPLQQTGQNLRAEVLNHVQFGKRSTASLTRNADWQRPCPCQQRTEPWVSNWTRFSCACYILPADAGGGASATKSTGVTASTAISLPHKHQQHRGNPARCATLGRGLPHIGCAPPVSGCSCSATFFAFLAPRPVARSAVLVAAPVGHRRRLARRSGALATRSAPSRRGRCGQTSLPAWGRGPALCARVRLNAVRHRGRFLPPDEMLPATTACPPPPTWTCCTVTVCCPPVRIRAKVTMPS